MSTCVLGIGNTLLTDEGAGVHAVRRLEASCDGLEDVEFLDGGTLSFELAELIAGHDGLIVIDATQLEDAPGTVKIWRDEAMDRFLTGPSKRSVHEVGLIDLMNIARLTGALPERRALVGIQPATVDWGEHPTPAVDRAIGSACEQIRDLLGEWQGA